MTKQSTYALVLVESHPAFLQKEVRGTSGHSYGYAAWDDKREAHVLRIPQQVYLGGAALDIARNVASVGNYVVYFEAEGDEATLRAEVERLTKELAEAKAAPSEIVTSGYSVTEEALSEQAASEVTYSASPIITRAALEATGKSVGGFRRLRKLALEHGVPGIETINKTDALLEAITNHLKLAA